MSDYERVSKKTSLIPIRAVIFSGALIIMMSFLGIVFLDAIREDILAEKKEILQKTLEVSIEALDKWFLREKDKIEKVVADKDLIKWVGEHVREFNETGEIYKDRYLKEIRQYFDIKKKFSGTLGFFVINADGINIGSKRDSNLGKLNLIAQKRPELFKKVLTGEVLLIPPIISDVPIKGAPTVGSTKLPATMFIAAPIMGKKGKVVAVVTHRLDPYGEFAEIAKFGEIGNTGETYFFDKIGRLLSDSRFTSDLKNTGKLSEENGAILSIELRDPVDSVKKRANESNPLTFMAQNAIFGGDVQNFDGYNDYRGIPVIGVWRWLDKYSIGITTEMDKQEAYFSYERVEVLGLLALGCTIGLSILFVLVNLTTARKGHLLLLDANRALEKAVEERTKELVLSEQHFKSLVMNIPGVVYRCLLDEHWTMEYISEYITHLTGYSRDDFINNSVRTYASIIHPDDVGVVDRVVREGVDNGVSYTIEYRVITKEGKVKWVFEQGKSFRNKDHEDLFLDGFIMDVTNRKRKDLDLLKLEQAVEKSPAMVMITNRDGRIEYVNPEFTKVTGYEEEEVRGKKPSLLKSDHHLNDFYSNLWNTLLDGEEWRGEIKNRKKDGDFYWEKSAIAPIKNSKNEIIHFVAIKEDITLRKEMEDKLLQAKKEAEYANKAKSEFLANMSHEIRTPMNAILGHAQILKRDKTITKDQGSSTTAILNAGNHLLTLINDVLDMSKIESGKLVLNPVTFSLKQVMQELDGMFVTQFEAKGLSLTFSFDENCLDLIIADEYRIKQILINLIGNALKFTDRGGVSVNVKTESDRAEISVKDTGCGISKEGCEKVFDAFVQEQRKTKESGGTGLGLAISKNLAEMMNGTITLESRVDKGTTFTLIFAFEVSDDSKTLEKKETHIIKTISAGQEIPEVLVVDDNEQNRTVARLLLESIGFLVNEAANGLEAVEYCHQNKPKVILMDLVMPVMDGQEAIKRIKELSYGDEISIVVVSASAKGDATNIALNNGASAFLKKPFVDNELFSLIGSLTGITFDYETISSNELHESEVKRDIEGMSDSVKEKLINFIQCGDIDGVEEMLPQIKGENQVIAEYIEVLVENCDIAQLKNLV